MQTWLYKNFFTATHNTTVRIGNVSLSLYVFIARFLVRVAGAAARNKAATLHGLPLFQSNPRSDSIQDPQCNWSIFVLSRRTGLFLFGLTSKVCLGGLSRGFLLTCLNHLSRDLSIRN